MKVGLIGLGKMELKKCVIINYVSIEFFVCVEIY